MSNKKIVYWAVERGEPGTNQNWNILYEDLQSLYNILVINKSNESNNNFFKCPSFIEQTKNIFVFNNPIHSKLAIKDDSVFSLSKSYVNSNIAHVPSIKENILLEYKLHFYFFCEESLTMSMSSPFFQNAPHLKYGAIVPGGFDIGSWFRRTNLEFNLWKNIKEIEIMEEEPLVYYKFETDSKIELQRFNMSETLYNIASTISQSSSWEPSVSLKKRYQRFRNSRTNDLVLKEIKKNLF